MANIILETKIVGDICGHFFPSYQRGYRWSNKEVQRLIDDILKNGDKPYCLQPIVVRKMNDKDGTEAQYELIDGQQRLTTIYLFYQFLHHRSMGFLPGPKFTIEYETREHSAEFLQSIDKSKANDNIDFWYMVNACNTMESLFPQEKAHLITKINQYLAEAVSVIWYEVPETEDSVSLFQRLNIGKIQLTSSELVKALFLRDAPDDSVADRQEEIALQWDNMERDLHDDSLWSFLTNKKTDQYATRIDLILDLMADKNENDKDPLSTFFYFDDLASKQNLYEVWKGIQASFLQLKEWKTDHELYHKIGYLIASYSNTLSDIFNLSKGKRKSEFRDELEILIRKSIHSSEDEYEEGVDIRDLEYGNRDNKMIERILLLFNVESVRTIDDKKQWFAFSKHKEKHWSLEHIHAQHSEGLDKNESRLQWLKAHHSSLVALKTEASTDNGEIDALLTEMDTLITFIKSNPKKGVGDQFMTIQEKVVNMFSTEHNQLHTIDNLALLDVGNNAALSNYVFDAKRNIVIDIDKSGIYIPFCTKMVFFKYYSNSEEVQLHFWGQSDRKAYLAAIQNILSQYLNPITKQANV